MKSILILLSAATLAFAGCATGDKATTADGKTTATCYVCRYNNDLSCVRVRVGDDTPRCECGGKTYYFCSEECRAAFLKKPTKYLPK